MIAAVIFSNTYWTFWDVMLFCFIWIPLMMIWFFLIFDVFRRRDLNGWSKALWLLAIMFLPWIGSIGYMILRPWGDAAEDFATPGVYTYGNDAQYYQGGYAATRPPVAD